MSSITKKLNITDFKCMMCDEVLAFDTNDPQTYVSKSSTEDFFSMKLSRYVVKHDTATEEHINVIIVDQNHKYRGHKDYYKTEKSLHIDYHINIFPPTKHSKIELLLIIDFQNHDVSEFINSNQIKTVNFTLKVDEFFRKNQDLYEHLPDELVFEYVNKKFYLLKRTDSIFIVISIFEVNFSSNLKKIIQTFTITNVHENSISNSIFTLVLRIIDISDINTDNEKIIEFIAWISNNVLLYVPLVIDKDDLARIPNFLSILPNNLTCINNSDFMNIFIGKITVIQYIQNNPADYKCVREIITLIDRRQLISKA